ncbi:MAG: hypothetical protein RBS92_08580, partial [Candidatus Cloacimonadales bacterium]|nr:hypothetical protein [Candidatus Cloacimonadales bacterium]
MKKQLLTTLLLVFLTAFAWAQIDLTSPTIPVLGTTDTVTPTLSWTENLTPDPTNYTITISKSPTMANPVYTGNENHNITNSHAIPTEHFLDYETTYYWQVQANNSSGLYGTPSTIGTFTTPKMSVVPHLRWAEITGESGDYTVEISDNSTFTTPITSTTTSDLYYKVATPLKYNTFYFWRVKRGASTSTTNSFTTKPLNLISESYKVSGSPITPYTSIAFGAVITYTAITDEFEDLSTQNANVNFTYSSTFVNSTPVVNQLLEYGTPDANYHSTISTNITAKQWDKTLSAFPIINITDNETLSLKF